MARMDGKSMHIRLKAKTHRRIKRLAEKQTDAEGRHVSMTAVVENIVEERIQSQGK
jgi:hypothetical protein